MFQVKVIARNIEVEHSRATDYGKLELRMALAVFFAAAFLLCHAESSVSLRDAASGKGVFVCSACNLGAKQSDAQYGPNLASQYDMIVPEDEGKWGPTSPYPGVYNFSQMDEMYALALSSQQQMVRFMESSARRKPPPAPPVYTWINSARGRPGFACSNAMC